MKREYAQNLGAGANRARWVRFAAASVAVLAMLFLFLPASHAQITGTITGTVYDNTGAVIPGANVTLVNQATQDMRTTVSTSEGYFAFPSLNPGTYTLKVEAKGFKSFQQSSIALQATDKRNVNATLEVGQTTETVTIEAHTDVIPVDSPARTLDLTAEDFNRLPMISRNATQLLAALPGAIVVANGSSNGAQSSFDQSTVGVVGSIVGNGVSIAGAPYRGGSQLLMDGTNIIDEGCDCTSITVPNPDMIQEVKIQTSAFGADSAKGPVVIDYISKSGSANWHGQGYFYARNAIFNSDSWQLNHAGKNVQTGDHYYYPGGNVGGPVPGTKKKLQFWFGYEHFYQLSSGGTIDYASVPTADMAAGNFGPTAANNALCQAQLKVNAASTDPKAAGTYCYDPSAGGIGPNGAAITSSNISSLIDPGGAALMGMIQKWDPPNANPASIAGNYNYVYPVAGLHNGYMYRGRGDYNLDDNNKLFVTWQYGSDAQPGDGDSHMWWLPGNSVRFPGGGLTALSQTKTLTANYLHVFSPTLTNQMTGFWTWFWGPQTPVNFNAVLRSTVGYPDSYGTQFGKTKPLAQTMVPGWNGVNFALPDFSQWDVFSGTGGQYYIKKQNPAFADDLTKVFKNHTFKAGFYYEMTGNNQANFNPINGGFSFGGIVPANSLGDAITGTQMGTQNPTANFLMGIATNYNEQSSLPLNDQAYKTFAFYGQDSWKLTRRFTLDYGVRFDHLGHWYDRDGYGNAVWLPANIAGDILKGKAYPGVEWHGINPGIPLSGTPNRLFHFEPRFGIAWDIFGNANTVLRGGWGVYAFNDQVNDYSGALALSQQSIQTALPSNRTVLFSETGLLPKPISTFSAPSSGTGFILDPTDYNVPWTTTWNLTIDQKLPWNSHFEIAYEGNDSGGLMCGGQVSGGGQQCGGDFINVNKTPLGAYFKPNPVVGGIATDPENVCGKYPDGTLVNPTACVFGQADYRPYGAYKVSSSATNCIGTAVPGAGCFVNVYGTNAVNVEKHVAYANYNALEVIWAKQAGRFTFNTSFTWSKALGFNGQQNNGNINPYDMRANYVILTIDRPYVWNTSYVFDFGKLYHGDNKVLGGATNGWTIAGFTSWQKGPDLQAQTGFNLGMGFTYAVPYVDANGVAQVANDSLTQRSFFGTDANMLVLPVETSDPTSGTAGNQLVKFSAFAAPDTPAGSPLEFAVPKCSGGNTSKCNATGYVLSNGQKPYAIAKNGPSQLPYISMPSFFNTDIALYKTFHITERHTVEFRVTATNWLNHPLVGFQNANPVTLSYKLDPITGGGYQYNNNNVPQAQWGYMNSKFEPSSNAYGRIMMFGLKYSF